MYKIRNNPVLCQYIVILTVNLSALCVGMNFSWVSPAIVKLTNGTDTGLPRSITENEGAWIVSIGFLFDMATSFTPPYLVDRLGRKASLILACLPRLITGLLFLFATEIWMVILARAFTGLSNSVTFTVLQIYSSEISSAEVRGRLASILQILSSVGVVLMICVGPFTSYLTLNIVYLTINMVTTIPLFFIPDSPYYLHLKGRTEESKKVLKLFRGTEASINEELKQYAATKTDFKMDKKELLKDKTFLKSVGIAIVLGAGIHLLGFNAVYFYLQTVLESTHTSVRSEIASLVIGFVQLIASVFSTFSTDKLGRKTILGVTLTGHLIGMLGLGTFFKITETQEIAGFLNYLPLISLLLLVFCYSAGVGSVYWVLSAEIFEDSSRPIGVSIGSVVSWTFLFLTSRFFASLTIAIGPTITYLILSVNTVLFFLFIMICVPETNGKSFSEIQTALGRKTKSINDKI